MAWVARITLVVYQRPEGAVLHRSALRSGLETLLTGGGAALLAYVVGAWLRAAFGAS